MTLRILVPVTGAFHGRLRVRSSSGVLDTEGLERILSKGSAQALTLAKQVADAHITVMHLDRGWGEGVIREALAHGADAGILIEWNQEWDCDASTRAKTIAELYAANGPFDLIVGPSDSSFGGFSGTLAAVAGNLGLPCYIGVEKIRADGDQLGITYGSMFGDYDLEVQHPCVLLSGDLQADVPTSWNIAKAYRQGILRVSGDTYHVQKPKTQRLRIEEVKFPAASSEEVDGSTLVRRLRSRSLIPEGSA